MRIAFTSDAFIHCLQLYPNLFQLTNNHGKLLVGMNYLYQNEIIQNTSLDIPWLDNLRTNWFLVEDIPTSIAHTELTSLIALDKQYPDDLIIIVDKLEQYAKLNTVYGEDSLLTPLLLQSLI